MFVSIGVLAYNERASLKELIPAICGYGRRHLDQFEVVVVDDGSTDGTRDWLEQISDDFPKVRWIRHRTNSGYAAATRTALTESKGDVRLVVDGDGQHPPEQITAFLEALKDGADVAMPVRSQRTEPWSRRLGSFILTAQCRILLSFPEKDINGGIKALTAEAAEGLQILHEQNLVNPEIWVRARNAKLSVVFVQVEQKERLDGTASRVLRNPLVLLFQISSYVTRLRREIIE